MPEVDAETYMVNPFDLAKVWNYADYPLFEIRAVDLQRGSINHFTEVKKTAFNQRHLRLVNSSKRIRSMEQEMPNSWYLHGENGVKALCHRGVARSDYPLRAR